MCSAACLRAVERRGGLRAGHVEPRKKSHPLRGLSSGAKPVLPGSTGGPDRPDGGCRERVFSLTILHSRWRHPLHEYPLREADRNSHYDTVIDGFPLRGPTHDGIQVEPLTYNEWRAT